MEGSSTILLQSDVYFSTLLFLAKSIALFISKSATAIKSTLSIFLYSRACCSPTPSPITAARIVLSEYIEIFFLQNHIYQIRYTIPTELSAHMNL
jgi:hypothetical protein